MTNINFYLIALIIAVSLTPCGISNAQEDFIRNPGSNFEASLSGNEEDQTNDQEDDKDKKKDKKDKVDKKDKKDQNYTKDNVEIGEKFFLSFLINLITLFIIVFLIYYPNYKKQEVFFTYFLFNIAIFLLTFLLNKIKISIGAAFGLFAVFSMLRYRTEGISMKDMTYLFIVIAIGLISAIQLEYWELGTICGIMVVSTYALDGNILIRRELSKTIQYDNIELIKPNNHEKLIEDLKNRTGLNIHRISIAKIDFLSDRAVVDIYYYFDKKKKGKEETEVDYEDKPL